MTENDVAKVGMVQKVGRSILPAYARVPVREPMVRVVQGFNVG